MRSLRFKGWWEKAEVADSPKPWETFEVWLMGCEAGDVVDNEKDIRRILKLSGYRLTLEKIKRKK